MRRRRKDNTTLIVLLVVGGAIAVAGAALVVVFAVALTKKRGHEPVQDVTPITAGDLIDDYRTNEVAADQLYKGRTLAVRGVVRRIGSATLGGLFVELVPQDATPFGFVVVRCSFTERQANELASLTPGQEVTIVGRCDGFPTSLTVSLGNCKLSP